MIVLTFGLPVTESDWPSPAVPFVDLEADDLTKLYPHEYVAVCALNNITKGTDTTHFSPYKNITRQQVITMVARAADNLRPAPWTMYLRLDRSAPRRGPHPRGQHPEGRVQRPPRRYLGFHHHPHPRIGRLGHRRNVTPGRGGPDALEPAQPARGIETCGCRKPRPVGTAKGCEATRERDS